ncbi:hypothetical protein Sango_2782000 [Sesamum angolense]|uniref:GOST seven transmembrane domain-containing protein n=1 Tax=Sesamum angolense TaxID=2727404 RepID=A0AAE1T948_9LAMI|nr:hypothetical protein Sango_2782000 [Sesamum angolense]
MLRLSSVITSLPLLAVLLLCAFRIEASVHQYAGEKFVGKGNAFVVHGGSEGIYASGPALNESSLGDSFIRLEKIVFRRPLDLSNFSSGSVHAILFEVDDRETIGGSAYGGQRAVCCTADLAKLGVCKQGQIIHHPSTNNPGWPQVFGASFDMDATETLQPRSIQITKTGMYNLYFIHCDPKLKEVTLDGKTVWKNPTGYLPGRMAPLMRFYGFMSLAFVLLGIFWFSQYARFWREVLPLQNCITLVITLGMFEMTLWYFDYAEFNETGVRPHRDHCLGSHFWNSETYCIKIDHPHCFDGLWCCQTYLRRSYIKGKARLFFVLPVAILDAFFILWIFTSLSSTLNKLQARRLSAKLDIYRKFTNALAVAVIVSVGWICYELYFKSKDVYNEQWQNAWIIPAFWQFLSFSLLCVICALWAPSQNSMRYAYSSEDAAEDFDKDDTLKLIKPSPLASKDVRSPELRSVGSGNGLSHTDLQEEKTA